MKENENTTVIHVTEKRSFVQKAQNKMEEVRQTYKEKMIDTGKSQDLERRIDEEAKRKKKVIKTVGTVATIVLIFVPADGPIGEMCTFFATPALCALTDVCAEMKKKALITGKREFEKNVLKVDGSNQNVTGFDLSDKNGLVRDFSDLKNKADELKRSM